VAFLLFGLHGLIRLTTCRWEDDRDWMNVMSQGRIMNDKRIVRDIASGDRDNELLSCRLGKVDCLFLPNKRQITDTRLADGSASQMHNNWVRSPLAI